MRIEEDLSDVYFRLAGVIIENLSWDNFIERYDRLETFFYCDPPYYKFPYYKHNMVFENYQQMSNVLSSIKGNFILSINDLPVTRKTFKDFNIKPVELKYSAYKGTRTEGKELLVSNF